MRALIITKIFPNPVEPLSCPFNRQQFAALKHYCDIEVLATIPWFPGARWAGRWSASGRLSTVPRESEVDGCRVRHPRVAYIPRVGHRVSGLLYAASLVPVVARLQGRVDVVLGSWLYPDGFAAVRLARLLGVPAVVKIHGTDLNVLPSHPGLSGVISWTLRNADRVVTVSRPLKERAIDLGAAFETVDIVRNGVDQSLFRPRDQREARERLGLDHTKKLVLFVGRLEPEKGVVVLLETIERLAAHRPDVGLLLVGDGSSRPVCERIAARHPGLVVVAKNRPLAEIPWWMAASDVVTLPSENEGTPNVVLEALSCGRRVVATDVGGIPDVLSGEELGELVKPGDVGGLHDALLRSVNATYTAENVCQRARVRGWDESAVELHESLVLAVSLRRNTVSATHPKPKNDALEA